MSYMSGTRAEHMAWCKERAYEYLDAGDAVNALASFTSDVSKHEETADLLSITPVIMDGMQYAAAGDVKKMREWIDGFA